LCRARFYSTDPSPPGQPAHQQFLPCACTSGHYKANRAAISSDRASCRAAPCQLLLPASTRTPVTLIHCLNVEGRSHAPFRPTSALPCASLYLLWLRSTRRTATPECPSNCAAGVPSLLGLTRRSSLDEGHRSELTRRCVMPFCSSLVAASPVPAFSIHSLTRPTQPQAPPEFHEPQRPLQLQPRPLLWPVIGDSPLLGCHCRGEPLTVSFPSLHRPKSDPRAAGVQLDHFPHPSHRRSPKSAGAAVAHAPWPPLPCFQFGPASFSP
jgi:hypothetical protein